MTFQADTMTFEPYCHYCARRFPFHEQDVTQHMLPAPHNRLMPCRKFGQSVPAELVVVVPDLKPKKSAKKATKKR